MTDHTDVLKNHPAADRLWSFIQGEYAERKYPFCTSWSTYATCSTTEEDILGELMTALYPENDYPDYLVEMPSLITNLITLRATKQSEQTKAINFLCDCMTDLVQCNVRENDTELADDETEEAA
jgi:hypothetical protein